MMYWRCWVLAKKRATKAERDHMDAVAAMGCMICKMPAEIHHVGNQGTKASNYEVIPLCPLHHRHGNVGVAVHTPHHATGKSGC